MENFEQIIIRKDDRLFEFVHNLVIMIESFAIGVNSHCNNPATFSEGTCLSCHSKVFNKEIQFPIYGSIIRALNNIIPIFIEVRIIEKKLSLDPNIIWNDKFASVVEYVFKPFFINYYETYFNTITHKYNGLKNSPEEWKVAWILRNALSHNGNITIKPHYSELTATWGNLTLNFSMNNKKVMYEIISAADLFLLMLDMDKCLD